MVAEDWCAVYCGDPTKAAEHLEEIIQSAFLDSFPKVTIKYKSTDSPWVNRNIRKLAKKKRREYTQRGKTHKWRELSKKMEIEV